MLVPQLAAWQAEQLGLCSVRESDPRIQAGSNVIQGGRRNIIPGIVMFSLLGLCGQTVFNAVDASRKERAADEVVERPSLMKRIANARWSPMRNLSNEQYVSMLKEKLLTVEAEIAVIDDKISELRGAETKSKEQGPRR